MGDDRHWFEKFSLLMERNIRGVQIGIYTVGICGLAIAFRSIRPFQRFVKPQDIPSHFVQNHVTLCGKVLSIEPGSGSRPLLLLIEHQPVVAVNIFGKPSNGLPVHLSGVDVSSNGISWLQHVVVGESVNFRPLKVTPTYASCIVNTQSEDVALRLVSLGFASVSSLNFSLEKDMLYLDHYKSLLAAEGKAEKKGAGMWAKDPSSVQRLMRKLGFMLKGMLPLPVLIRS